MMVERLKAYQAKNNKLPTRVLVYRDGVSEGQFQIVVGEELPEIKAAFKQFGTPKALYNPQLTIIICGKRHHTRFFPTDPSAADRDGNPRPGTVVDRGVTAVYDYDFFLQGQSLEYALTSISLKTSIFFQPMEDSREQRGQPTIT